MSDHEVIIHIVEDVRSYTNYSYGRMCPLIWPLEVFALRVMFPAVALGPLFARSARSARSALVTRTRAVIIHIVVRVRSCWNYRHSRSCPFLW